MAVYGRPSVKWCYDQPIFCNKCLIQYEFIQTVEEYTKEECVEYVLCSFIHTHKTQHEHCSSIEEVFKHRLF